MKTTTILMIAFVIGLVASTRALVKATGDDGVKYVYHFDELDHERSDDNKAYLSFLSVDSMHCGVYSLEAGGVDGQQPHTEDEVYFVQSGEAKIQISGKDYDLKPGSIVFVPAYAEHRFHSITKDLKTLVFFSKVKIDKPNAK